MEHAERHPSSMVVKVGGSLFDLPELGPRLCRWLDSLDTTPANDIVAHQPAAQAREPLLALRAGENLLDCDNTPHVVLLPGGGPTADVVCQFDRWQHLGDEAAHWLALQSLSLNAQFLAHIVPGAAVVQEVAACPALWQQQKIPILDAYAFARADEGQPGCLPHSWNVTSDALAARVALVLGASRLILLKSTELPDGLDWAEAGRHGLVDPYFGEVIEQGTVAVQWVNLRKWQP